MITGEGQLNEMRHQFDVWIAELVTNTEDQTGQLEQHGRRLGQIWNQSEKLLVRKQVEEWKVTFFKVGYLVL